MYSIFSLILMIKKEARSIKQLQIAQVAQSSYKLFTLGNLNLHPYSHFENDVETVFIVLGFFWYFF